MDGLHDGLSCQNRTHNAQTQISRVHTDISLWISIIGTGLKSVIWQQNLLSDWPSVKKLRLSPYA